MKKILIVENDLTDFAFLKVCLKMIPDIEFDRYDSPEVVFKIVKDFTKYSIIITDGNFGASKIDGFEFCERLRNMGVKIPIIFSSAYATPERIEKALKHANEYILKPFASKDFSRVLLKYL